MPGHSNFDGGKRNTNQTDQTHQQMNTTNQEMKDMPNEQHEWDNRSDQLNPNNDSFYQSRGWDDKEEHDNYDDWGEK